MGNGEYDTQLTVRRKDEGVCLKPSRWTDVCVVCAEGLSAPACRTLDDRDAPRSPMKKPIARIDLKFGNALASTSWQSKLMLCPGFGISETGLDVTVIPSTTHDQMSRQCQMPSPNLLLGGKGRFWLTTNHNYQMQ